MQEPNFTFTTELRTTPKQRISDEARIGAWIVFLAYIAALIFTGWWMLSELGCAPRIDRVINFEADGPAPKGRK